LDSCGYDGASLAFAANEIAISALADMAKFFLALITIALAALIGAFIFAAFTL
jgi:hypothetical protein